MELSVEDKDTNEQSVFQGVMIIVRGTNMGSVVASISGQVQDSNDLCQEKEGRSSALVFWISGST